jgi:hypothetical protein
MEGVVQPNNGWSEGNSTSLICHLSSYHSIDAGEPALCHVVHINDQWLPSEMDPAMLVNLCRLFLCVTHWGSEVTELPPASLHVTRYTIDDSDSVLKVATMFNGKGPV